MLDESLSTCTHNNRKGSVKVLRLEFESVKSILLKGRLSLKFSVSESYCKCFRLCSLDTTSRSVVSGLGTDVGRELCRQQQNVDEAGLAAIFGDRSLFAFIVDSI